jgi:ABC-type arginine transport system permease subunit
LIFALASLSASRAVRWGMVAAIDFFRAVPPVVLLIFVYSGLPFAGIRLSPLAAVAARVFPQHLELLWRDLPRRDRERRAAGNGTRRARPD